MQFFFMHACVQRWIPDTQKCESLILNMKLIRPSESLIHISTKFESLMHKNVNHWFSTRNSDLPIASKITDLHLNRRTWIPANTQKCKSRSPFHSTWTCFFSTTCYPTKHLKHIGCLVCCLVCCLVDILLTLQKECCHFEKSLWAKWGPYTYTYPTVAQLAKQMRGVARRRSELHLMMSIIHNTILAAAELKIL